MLRTEGSSAACSKARTKTDCISDGSGVYFGSGLDIIVAAVKVYFDCTSEDLAA